MVAPCAVTDFRAIPTGRPQAAASARSGFAHELPFRLLVPCRTLAGVSGGSVADDPAHGGVDSPGICAGDVVRGAARLWWWRGAPPDRRLCRNDPQHAIAGAD